MTTKDATPMPTGKATLRELGFTRLSIGVPHVPS